MGDLILFLIVVVALITVWIEWLPRKYDILIGICFSIMIIGIGIGWLPRWYGWVVAAIGVAYLAGQYYKGAREFGWPHPRVVLKRAAWAVHALLGVTVGLFKRMKRPVARTPDPKETAAPTQTRIRRRVWVGGIALTVLSPITAIPTAVALAMVLTIINSVLVDAGSLTISSGQIIKSVLGTAYVIQVATLDLVVRGFLVSVPLLLATCVGAASWADRSGCYWQRLLAASALIGALYPSIFIVASTMGWFDEPFFN